jgi:hypothetical protein
METDDEVLSSDLAQAAEAHQQELESDREEAERGYREYSRTQEQKA